MLELGANISYTIRAERSGLYSLDREVYFPALYNFKDSAWDWWATELDVVGSIFAERHYTFYTRDTIKQVLCHRSKANDFVFDIFDTDADIWIAV